MSDLENGPSAPDVSVILPTYNEGATVASTLTQLDAALQALPYSCEILVVDDDSPDKTAELARATCTRLSVRIISRVHDRGLASAILRGIHESRGRVCAVLDCDGSHDPTVLPRLIEPILAGDAEMTLGSRYVSGGSIEDWPRYRRLMSRWGTWLARPLLWRAKVRDPLTGYFAVEKRILGREPIHPIGFKIAFEILVRCRPRPVLEVPYRFRDRSVGISKFGRKQVGAYLRHLGQLYRFTLFGSP